jgi:hypothetical protein
MHVVLVGDADQLAPVGAGKPFAELVAIGAVPVARLTHIFRQAAGSMIVQGAHAVRTGEPPSFAAEEGLTRDLFLIERDDPAGLIIRYRYRLHGADFSAPTALRAAARALGDLRQPKRPVRQVREEGAFSIGAACYPEGHIDCNNLVQDIKYLREKVDTGVDFLISQLFFDNELFYRFMDAIDLAGIDIPVSAGIMPVLNKNQILRITKLAGCELPPKFKRILDRYEKNPEALKEAGEAYAIEQIIDLMAWGARGIHLYTMNKPDTAKRIIGNIENIRKLQV